MFFLISFSMIQLINLLFLIKFHRNVGMKFQELTYVLTALENLDLDLLEQVAIHEFDEVSATLVFILPSLCDFLFLLFYTGVMEKKLSDLDYA